MSGGQSATTWNKERVRKVANSFDPMKAEHWTLWQALAWALHGDADKVRECTDFWEQKGPTAPVEGAALRPFRRIWEEIDGFNKPVTDCWHKLWIALESGKVRSSGVANGQRVELADLEWPSLRPAVSHTISQDGLLVPVADRPQLYRDGAEFWRMSGNRPQRAEPAFRDVWVRRTEVMKEFPPPVTSRASGSADRIRGRRPIKTPAVEAAMRQMDPKRLDEMKEEEMATEFGAVRSTCRAVRDKVLANYRQLPPIAK